MLHTLAALERTAKGCPAKGFLQQVHSSHSHRVQLPGPRHAFGQEPDVAGQVFSVLPLRKAQQQTNILTGQWGRPRPVPTIQFGLLVHYKLPH